MAITPYRTPNGNMLIAPQMAWMGYYRQLGYGLRKPHYKRNTPIPQNPYSPTQKFYCIEEATHMTAISQQSYEKLRRESLI